MRVCDAYGAGFYYIPGTETCLQISGPRLVPDRRHQRQRQPLVHTRTTTASVTTSTTRAPTSVFSSTPVRRPSGARCAATSVCRLPAATARLASRRDDNILLDQAYLQLGGFLAGYTESLFVHSNVIGGVTAFTGSNTWNGLYYGYQQRQSRPYTPSVARKASPRRSRSKTIRARRTSCRTLSASLPTTRPGVACSQGRL